MARHYILARLISKISIPSFKNCNIDKTAFADTGCVFNGVNMGRYSYANERTYITDTDIGAFTSIGASCQIGGGQHPVQYVSTSPVFWGNKNRFRKNYGHEVVETSKRVQIGNDVWIGYGCFIKAGIKIGSGAVIGANSVVTHDVEPYTIVAGTSARIIRKRFSDETISKLKKIKWWDWNEKLLESFGDDFTNPDKLIDRYESLNK